MNKPKSGLFLFMPVLMFFRTSLIGAGGQQPILPSAANDIAADVLSVRIGHGNFNYRDAPQLGSYLNIIDVSPVKLIGRGPIIDLSLERVRGRKVRHITLSLRHFGNFIYDSGLHREARAGTDSRTEMRLGWRLDNFRFTNVAIRDLDIGLGPRLSLASFRTKRHFSPDIGIRLHECHFSAALVMSARYGASRSLAVQFDFVNGLVAGLARNHYDRLGAMPRLNAALGWLTDYCLSVRLTMFRRIDVGLFFGTSDYAAFGFFGQYILTGHQILAQLRYSLGGSP